MLRGVRVPRILASQRPYGVSLLKKPTLMEDALASGIKGKTFRGKTGLILVETHGDLM